MTDVRKDENIPEKEAPKQGFHTALGTLASGQGDTFDDQSPRVSLTTVLRT
jgi:hypothetical protein